MYASADPPGLVHRKQQQPHRPAAYDALPGVEGVARDICDRHRDNDSVLLVAQWPPVHTRAAPVREPPEERPERAGRVQPDRAGGGGGGSSTTRQGAASAGGATGRAGHCAPEVQRVPDGGAAVRV